MIQVYPLQHTVLLSLTIIPSVLEMATVLLTEPRTMSAHTADGYFLLYTRPLPLHYSFQFTQQGTFILFNVYAKWKSTSFLIIK